MTWEIVLFLVFFGGIGLLILLMLDLFGISDFFDNPFDDED